MEMAAAGVAEAKISAVPEEAVSTDDEVFAENLSAAVETAVVENGPANVKPLAIDLTTRIAADVQEQSGKGARVN